MEFWQGEKSGKSRVRVINFLASKVSKNELTAQLNGYSFVPSTIAAVRKP